MNKRDKVLLQMIYAEVKGGREVILTLMPKLTDFTLRREAAVGLKVYGECAVMTERLIGEKQVRGVRFSVIERLAVRGAAWVETAGVTDQESLRQLLATSAFESAQRLCREVASLGTGRRDEEVLTLGRRVAGGEMTVAERLHRI